MTDEVISSGFHWQYGWLRRPELDDSNGYCYEDGDGDLIYSKRPHHKKNMHLTAYRDTKTGEAYLALSKHHPMLCEMAEYVKRRGRK